MGVGQALLGALYGDPSQQISRTLNPGGPNPTPNPNPGAAPPPGGAPGAVPGGPQQPPGGSGGPSGAPSTGPPQPQPPMAASNATQSPPDLAALYVQLHRQDQAAAGIDRGIQGMGAAFGTAQQQHDMMDAWSRMPGADDRGKMLGNIIDDQAAQTKAQEHSRFLAGAAGMSKLLGDSVTPEQAQWLALNPDIFNEVLKTHQQVEADKQKPTDLMKNADAEAAQWAAANPNATPAEIAAHKASVLSGMIPGPAGEILKKQAVDSQTFKDNAFEDYAKSNQKLDETERTIDRLLNNPENTVKAITTSLPETGTAGSWNYLLSPDVKDRYALVEKLKAGLSGDSLRDVKNVRNVREFDTLGKSATGGLTQASSPQQILQTLQDMKNKILDARATNEMSVGHHLTGNLVGRGQQDLIQPTINGKPNPFYNGATQDEKAAAASGGGGGFNYDAIPSGTVYTAPDGSQRKKP